jgi:hypothetical protein
MTVLRLQPSRGVRSSPHRPRPPREKYQRSAGKKNILNMTHDEYVESWNSTKLAVVATTDADAKADAENQVT